MIQLDHPCRQTCSGWAQGRERGFAEGMEAAAKLCEEKYGNLREYNAIGARMATKIREAAVEKSKQESAGPVVGRKGDQGAEHEGPSACAHQWKSKRRGGDPQEASSDERVAYCDLCGEEWDWHGCRTGDCPHDTQTECDKELRKP